MALTVDELTHYIRGLFWSDELLEEIEVQGEVLESKLHSSGHLYFSLTGEDSRISCVMFAPLARVGSFWLSAGDVVLVRGSVRIYPKRGIYQLYVETLTPIGQGALERQKAERYKHLEAEGLFRTALKRSLPENPRVVAVLTSVTSEAAHDVIRVSMRRNPLCKLVFFPTQVQGKGAIAELLAAFASVAKYPCLDAVLLVRGGGSRDAFSVFDDERLVRALRLCPVPVITGIGHERDWTFCDLAADVVASTPSAAAELLLPDVLLEMRNLADRCYHAKKCLLAKINVFRSRLSGQVGVLRKLSQSYVARDARALNRFITRLKVHFRQCLEHQKSILSEQAVKLHALSPLLALQRGFVVCEYKGKRIYSVNGIDVGGTLTLRFRDGKVFCDVKGVEKLL